MSMQRGVVLEHDLCPETPDLRQQKMYSSSVAKVQFPALWIRCEIAFRVSQLARFCASAGASPWAALHDVIEEWTIFETADGQENIKSTYICTETYFVRNRTGEVVTITVPALFVKGLPQDLFGGKSVNRANIRVIFAFRLRFKLT